MKKRNSRRNFCDINPIFWNISMNKKILERKIRDIIFKEKYAKETNAEKLPVLLYKYSSNLRKKGNGINPNIQESSASNIKLASSKITGIIIYPGEVFSFWKILGKVTQKKGYKDGRILKNNKLIIGIGGGLCNLANNINNLILHSPLEIIEFHKHSDALACDIGSRIPMSNGTSVSYNYIDYRFKNNTNQKIQIIIWYDENKLYSELRGEIPFKYSYEVYEENHHFKKEDDKIYRVSKIYQNKIDKDTGKIITKKLIWDNHSLVMFDYKLIPVELIK